jgi:hypothetical protein
MAIGRQNPRKLGRGRDARGSGHEGDNERQDWTMWGNQTVMIEILDGWDGLAMEGGLQIAWMRA